MTYCEFSNSISAGDKLVHKIYHDKFYGFPIDDDNELFGRFILEINQAGLSWETILKKEDSFRIAYDGFDIFKIASYEEEDINRLLSNSKIIRNRLKINAAIHNAKSIMVLKEKYGTFKNWLDVNHPLSKEEWVKLFKKHFKFVGGEIVNEFLMSTGYLEGAHTKDCPIYEDILNANPKWNQK